MSLLFFQPTTLDIVLFADRAFVPAHSKIPLALIVCVSLLLLSLAFSSDDFERRNQFAFFWLVASAVCVAVWAHVSSLLTLQVVWKKGEYVVERTSLQ